MSGAFTIDRSNRARAIATMDAAAAFSRKNRVGVWIWPGECLCSLQTVGTLHRTRGD